MKAAEVADYSVVRLPDGRLGMFSRLIPKAGERQLVIFLADGSAVRTDEEFSVRLVAHPGEVIRATLPFLEAVLAWFAEADLNDAVFADDEQRDAYEDLYRAVEEFVQYRVRLGWAPEGSAAMKGFTTYPKLSAPEVLLLQTQITELITEAVSGPNDTRFRTVEGSVRWTRVTHSINRLILKTLLDKVMPDLDVLSGGTEVDKKNALKE